MQSTVGVWTDTDTKALRAKVTVLLAEGRLERCEQMLDRLYSNTTMPVWLFKQQFGRILTREAKEE